MAAPEGNEFWKLRSKHGRDLIFSNPEILWEAANEYFEVTTNRKWIRTEFNGKDAIECEVPTSAPFTMTGLYTFLEITAEGWREYRKRKDFSEIVTRIEQIIYTQKFEGAAVGAYNSSIIARDLGLADKKEVEKTVKKLNFKDAE